MFPAPDMQMAYVSQQAQYNQNYSGYLQYDQPGPFGQHGEQPPDYGGYQPTPQQQQYGQNGNQYDFNQAQLQQHPHTQLQQLSHGNPQQIGHPQQAQSFQQIQQQQLQQQLLQQQMLQQQQQQLMMHQEAAKKKKPKNKPKKKKNKAAPLTSLEKFQGTLSPRECRILSLYSGHFLSLLQLEFDEEVKECVTKCGSWNVGKCLKDGVSLINVKSALVNTGAKKKKMSTRNKLDRCCPYGIGGQTK